jgi:dephospho-CoA kinase
MFKVGICGTIGSGKSTVCHIFEDMGIPVYFADDRAKMLMCSSTGLMQQICEAFGRECYNDGVLDRRYLASQIFGDDSKRLLLNSIVHPAVCRDFVLWAERQKAAYVIVESAILFESGLDKVVDKTVAVVVPEQIALERAAARDGVDIEAVRARMAVQMNVEQLSAKADFIIENICQQALPEQVARVDALLRRL